MARGFLGGLGWGAAIGGAGLVALSLLAPLPDAADQGGLDLGLPVGSEFGRGGDVAPVLPAPTSAAPRERAEPMAVPAPPTEPAPRAMPGDTSRPAPPQADAAATGLTQPQDAPAVAVTLPSGETGASRPAATPAPDMAAPDMAGPDEAPRAPTPDPAPDPAPVVAPEERVTAPPAQPNAAPALPSPGLDLSLPPDLTDLRRLERN